MKPEPIIRNIEVVFGRDKFDPSKIPGQHASLYTEIEYDAVTSLLGFNTPGGGQEPFHRVGGNNGYIGFKTAADGVQKIATTLSAGADGSTNYLKVTATYTAPEATTVVDLYLIGTRYYRVNERNWSIDAGVNQALLDAQDYIINWTIRADI